MWWTSLPDEETPLVCKNVVRRWAATERLARVYVVLTCVFVRVPVFVGSGFSDLWLGSQSLTP